MAQPKFSIGIDLGTSNSVLAFSPLSGEGGSEVLAIPQWDTSSTVTESTTVPSFLYLPDEAIAAQIRGHSCHGDQMRWRSRTKSLPLTRRRLFSLIFAQHGTPGSQGKAPTSHSTPRTLRSPFPPPLTRPRSG